MDLEVQKDRERLLLRDYLLGRIDEESELEAIESRLLTDDAFYEELGFQEDELIEAYLDDDLDNSDRAAFTNHFCVPHERLEKLRFAEVLHKRMTRSSVAAVEPKPSLWSAVTSYLAPAPLAVAAVVVSVAVGLLLWSTYRSPMTDEAILALNKAYKTERPVEARVTSLGYAPFYKVRSDRPSQIDLNEQARAELLIRRRVSDSNDAAAHHALGRLAILKMQFDEGIKELETAERLDGSSPEILNDLGAAYLEKFKSVGVAARPEHAQLPRLALQKIDNAIELKPAMPEAYFNRAQSLEALDLPNEARAAWQRYLELDPDSDWSTEAREHLKLLDTTLVPELTGDELEHAFLDAYRRRADGEAFDLASRNRELIREKYIPHRLAASAVQTSGPDRKEKINALEYLGQIENERIGDLFASELAKFYRGLSEQNVERVREAHHSLREGYSRCLAEDFKGAKEKFEFARERFLAAGDAIEAETIAKYFIAYSVYYSDRAAAAVVLREIDDFTTRRQFRWLGLMNRYWWLGARESLGEKTFTRTKLDYQVALQEAKQMGDAYMTQKFLQSLLLKAAFVKARKDAMRYAHELLEFSNQPGLSVRQKIRILDKLINVSTDESDASFSKALVLENIASATTIRDPSFVMAAELNAAIVHTRTRDFEAAEQWLEKAQATVERLPDGATGKEDLPKIFLHQGHLKKAEGDLAGAMPFYERSVDLSRELGTTTQGYEAQKARLLTLHELGKSAAVEEQIAPAIELAEGYRKTLNDEQERNTFFDSEQEVYDTAIDFELKRGHYEQAYDFAEQSSSRSLLDHLQEEVIGQADSHTAKANPLALADLRAILPTEVQLLHYRLLKDRLVIWLITKDKFATKTSPVAASELTDKVSSYLQLVQSKDGKAQAEARILAGELYNLLIDPVSAELDPDKQISIIPNRILFYLPFSSLLSVAKGKYLIEDFVLLYAPSANVFLQCTKNARTKSNDQTETILSIGNPAFDRAEFEGLLDLPESSKEAKAVTAGYRTPTILSGREATPRAFQSIYKEFDVIHFAGHYITEPTAPLSSKLILARSEADNGVLTNGELMKSKLPRAKLVVLSACETAVEGYYAGEGFVGLSRTFLAVGVPVVVASSWPVDSAATTTLMRKFHSYRRNGMVTPRALQSAQTDMIRDAAFNRSQPFAWAGFSVFGGYATF